MGPSRRFDGRLRQAAIGSYCWHWELRCYKHNRERAVGLDGQTVGSMTEKPLVDYLHINLTVLLSHFRQFKWLVQNILKSCQKIFFFTVLNYLEAFVAQSFCLGKYHDCLLVRPLLLNTNSETKVPKGFIHKQPSLTTWHFPYNCQLMSKMCVIIFVKWSVMTVIILAPKCSCCFYSVVFFIEKKKNINQAESLITQSVFLSVASIILCTR